MTQDPRPEYPRPQFQRDQWHSLNGPWRFTFDPAAVGEQERWYVPGLDRAHATPYGPNTRGKTKPLTINVPFPWESPASGVMRPDYKGAAWYEREFTVPAGWDDYAPVLNFGAVDWHARVWVNGRLAGEHANGYLPFAVDVSRFVQPGETATVTVRAFDMADASTMVGKQVPRWYTHSSGIWQPVWLEARPASYIEAVRIAPDVAHAQAHVTLTLHVAAAGRYTVSVAAEDDAFAPVTQTVDLDAGAHDIALTLSVPSPRLWSPESPHLYPLRATLTPAAGGPGDVVATYFGMRTVSRAKWAGKEYEYILLNGEPVYLRGALDQAFHPETLHAYPSDDVIRGDIQLAKDLGLNMLRCHIKINDPRYYYWADKLGLLMMYDLPSPDLDTPAMRRMYEAALPRAMARDFNSPSIFAWVLFNETWGLTEHDTADSHRWVQRMLHTARALDPTRLVEDNSPCHYNHVESDINSWHFYINNYRQVRRHIQNVVDQTYPGSAFNYVGGDFVQGDAPLMNSEYGGIAARDGDQDIAWCFKYQTNELRRHAKICGYVYTELDDIEWEHNGFVNYDRSAKEFGYDHFVPGMTVADLNGADFVGVDAPPCQTVAAGARVDVPVFVSHWGAPLDAARVQWTLTFTDRFGRTRTVAEDAVNITPARFDVTGADALQLTLPDEAGLATLALVLVDGNDTPRAKNYVNFQVDAAVPTVEPIDNGWAVRFDPGDVHATSWPQPRIPGAGGKFAATGRGWVEYRIKLPAEVTTADLAGIRLELEAGARAGMAKVDWIERTYGFNYPQTEATKAPSDVRVRINGIDAGTLHLPDDPADARGVLSHHHGIDPGSYGFPVAVTLTGAALADALARDAQSVTVRLDVLNTSAGGLAIYGARCGSLPTAPTLYLVR